MVCITYNLTFRPSISYTYHLAPVLSVLSDELVVSWVW